MNKLDDLIGAVRELAAEVRSLRAELRSAADRQVSSTDVVARESRAAPAEFMTVDEAAELLRVNKHTLYDAIKAGDAPWARTIGRVVRINRAALLRWSEQGGEAPRKQRRT